jgi:preprotein translocase subunit SecA
MFAAIVQRLFGSANERTLNRFRPLVAQINALEPEVAALSDAGLQARTAMFRQQLAAGAKLDDLLVPAFATVREAAKRTLGQRHYDMQLLGGCVLHHGMIAEMKTGEGKTLVATLPVYLNALTGRGVHVVTVNDYLARRDAEWMAQVYRFLGLTVDSIVSGLNDGERHTAYSADITYGTNNQFGFDYMRDNMKFRLQDRVMRPFNFAIVDEVDSILVDEARTPLIISGQAEDSSALYLTMAKLVPQLGAEDVEVDEKLRTAVLTEVGAERLEQRMRAAGLIQEGGLYDLENVQMVHYVNQALKAEKIFKCDVDYIIKDDKVVIIDEFTGRMMEDRRYSGGLHQALEAKERVSIQNENQTLATITFQNYFRLYPKLAGMTGTAMTEAAEFFEIYKLEVVEMPTNLPVQRQDADDEIYRSAKEKNEAVLKLIEECYNRRQPVLVGTVSIEKSEILAAMLKKKKIPHQVLNARHHEREAEIVAEAGRPGAVTIATNMAGRGTDIQLGGSLEQRCKTQIPANATPEQQAEMRAKIQAEIAADKQIALAAGGLYVIGTERHESRRIDNQLRGRSGRQGDPGASRFFISLEDDLMRIFGSERMDSMLQRLGMPYGEAISHPWVSKALEKAQQRVEANNFERRKWLLRYDDVINAQRKMMYEQRAQIIDTDNIEQWVANMHQEVVEDTVSKFVPPESYPEQWDIEGLGEESRRLLNLDLPLTEWAAREGAGPADMLEEVRDHALNHMKTHLAAFPPELCRLAAQKIVLDELDKGWRDHLSQLDHLREGIGLRAYGQRDPLSEFKREAFIFFEAMLSEVRENVVAMMSRLEIRLNMPQSLPEGMVLAAGSGLPRAMREVTGQGGARLPNAAINPGSNVATLGGQNVGQPPVMMTLNRASRRRSEKLQRETPVKAPSAK